MGNQMANSPLESKAHEIAKRVFYEIEEENFERSEVICFIQSLKIILKDDPDSFGEIQRWVQSRK